MLCETRADALFYSEEDVTDRTKQANTVAG
jgi:hypothetical protein